MIVLVTSAIPNLLRGKLTRWLFELMPGTFVGNVSARVRDELWTEVEEGAGRGKALLVYPERNEQGMAFRTVGQTWQPMEIEGLTLILQPSRGANTAHVSKKSKKSSAMESFPRKEKLKINRKDGVLLRVGDVFVLP
ncbi:type I-E CRISPR-associated endoribonuclease Cas2e [Arcanobacterium hippocoleae]|uniref:type I-E CRISPR-associated endoribonuclease Cas2e n=1 Tax=Arcanobacterium hippocoleae TaxID=149017 RepID=UPI003341A0CE